MTTKSALMVGLAVTCWSSGVLAQGSMRDEIEGLRAWLPETADMRYDMVEGSPFDGVGRVEDLVIIGFAPDVSRLEIGELVIENAVEVAGNAASFGRLFATEILLEDTEGSVVEVATLELLDVTGLHTLVGPTGMDFSRLTTGPVSMTEFRVRGTDPSSGSEFDVITGMIGFDGIQDGFLQSLEIANLAGNATVPETGELAEFGIGAMSYEWLNLESSYYANFSVPAEEGTALAEIVSAFETLEEYADDFGPFEGGPFSLRVDETKIGIETITGAYVDVDGGGYGATMTLTGMGIDTDGDAATREAMRRDYGADSMLFDMDMMISHDEAGGRLALDQFQVGWRDVLDGQLAITIGGERPLEKLRQLRDNEIVDFAQFDLGLAAAGLSIDAGPQFMSVFERLAADMGLNMEQATAALLAPLQAMSAAQPNARLDSLIVALQGFLADPVRLQIAIDPNTPIGLHEAMTAAMVAPMQLLDRANLTVVNEP